MSNNKLYRGKDSKEKLERKPVLVAEDIIKIYRTGKIEVQALRGVSFKVYAGEKLFFIGPSGSGKTTLVNIVAGLSKPTAGKVFWENMTVDITRLPFDEIIKRRRRFAGIIFQDSKLISHLNVIENVQLAGFYAGLKRNEVKARTEYLLKYLDLWDKRKKKETQLSGGEKKRVAIASALVTQPKILIADEPTGDLDLVTANATLDLLDRINEELGVALLLVTHSQNVASRADRIIELQDGIIIGQHSKVKLRALGESRYLELDNQRRLKLPKEVIENLGEPKHFIINVKNGKLILIPKKIVYKKKK